jgi:hypothetical protein
MTLTHDKHVLACALWVEKHHGDRDLFIAKQIGQLAFNGDEAGMAMWKEIAAAYTQLMVPAGRKPS